MQKTAIVFVILVSVLLGALGWTAKKSYDAGYNKAKLELQEIYNEQAETIQKANKKIIDLQTVISNNNDECFNRLWSEDTINAVNPQLRRYDDLCK